MYVCKQSKYSAIKESLFDNRHNVAGAISAVCINHTRRLSIDRPTKRGKEKSPSDGQCQCEKEMDNHLLACHQIFEREPHIVSRNAKERASFLKINDINDISFFGTPDCHHCYSIE
jgi:hypothetical protein